MKLKHLFICLCLISTTFCGSNPTLRLTLSGPTAFQDSNVKDIVFVIINIPGPNGGLDQDNDGVADSFVYPSGCGGAKPAGCGFPPQSGDLEVGDLPLNFQYKVTVQLRNATGTVIHSGSATFDNKKDAQAVAIVVN